MSVKVNSKTVKIPNNVDVDDLSGKFTSMRLNHERKRPVSGPGITFGPENPDVKLRGTTRRHLSCGH